MKQKSQEESQKDWIYQGRGLWTWNGLEPERPPRSITILHYIQPGESVKVNTLYETTTADKVIVTIVDNRDGDVFAGFVNRKELIDAFQ